MVRWPGWIISVALALALIACGPAPDAALQPTAIPTLRPTATPRAPTPTADVAVQLRAMEQALAEAEARWQRQGLRSYRLVVGFSNLGSDVRMTVVVRDGALASAECEPLRVGGSGCEWAEQRTTDFTVAGLFGFVRSLHRQVPHYAQWSQPADLVMVKYDRQLGYPASMSWFLPEGASQSVVEFEALP